MFEVLTSIVTGVLGGGATGLLGVLLQRFFDWRKQSLDIEIVKLQNQNAIELRALEIQGAAAAAALSASAQAQLAEIDLQSRFDASAAAAYVASHQADKATYLDAEAQRQSWFARLLMAVVDFSRGIVRPWGTVYLMAVTTAMFWWTTQLAAESGVKLSTEQILGLQMRVIETILYLVTTSWVWWFGVRPSGTRGK